MLLIRQIIAEQAKIKHLLFYSNQQMTATLAIFGNRILGINQFFSIKSRGLNRGFGITPKVKAVLQNSLLYYSGLDN